jgi:pimeloyl-ACP methyl ester carboxylesterase
LETTSIDGIDIAYRVSGDPAARPIVLIHGYTGNTRNWALTIKPLVEAGWRTLTADNPGHGHTSAPNDPQRYTMAAMADLHHQLAKRLDFVPAVIVGHSMGGAIAEEYAIRYPDDVVALVLVDSAGGGQRDGAMDGAIAKMVETGRKIALTEGMGALWDYQVANGGRALPANISPEMRDLARSEFALTSPTGYLNCAEGMRNRRNTLPGLAELAKPTLVIRGENENPGLVQAADGLANAIPGARYEVIPNAAHSPQFENMSAFNEVLTAFLGTLPG